MPTGAAAGVAENIKTGGFRPDIQGLRTIAVLTVLASHAAVPGFSGGFVGVDVFFVISGFLITGLLIKEAQSERSISIAGFYARRARRILPAATLVLIATFLATAFFLGNVRTLELVPAVAYASVFLVNWKFAFDGTDYFQSALPPSPVQQYWSLSVEEQFYLVWPIIIALVGLGTLGRRRSSLKPRWAVLLTVIVALSLASFLWSILSTASSPTVAYFSTLTRAWELGVGAIIALLTTRLSKLPNGARAALSWIGLAGIAVAVVWYSDSTPFPGYAAALPVLATASVLISGIGGASQAGANGLLGLPPMQWIGDRSYSLYLWHWPFLIIGEGVLGPLDPVGTAALIVGAFVATELTYRFIERPIHKGFKNAGNAPFLVLWPASVCVVVSLVALSVTPIRSALLPPASTTTVSFETAAPDETTGSELDTDPVVAAVMAAVALVVEEAPIPEALTPAPGQARSDSWNTTTDCGVSQPGTTTAEVCNIGEQGSQKSIVVFGDSHAGMWLPALTEIASEQDWAIYPFVKYGCTAWDVVLWRDGGGGAQTECAEWRSWAVEQASALAPTVTILSSRGAYSLTGSDNTRLDREEAFGAYQQGVVSAIQQMQQAGGRVVVFSDTPVSELDPVTCLDTPTSNMASCAFEMSPDAIRATASNAQAAAATGGSFVDLTDWFCSDNICPSAINQMTVYFDPGHITATYGRELAPYLAERAGLAAASG